MVFSGKKTTWSKECTLKKGTNALTIASVWGSFQSYSLNPPRLTTISVLLIPEKHTFGFCFFFFFFFLFFLAFFVVFFFKLFYFKLKNLFKCLMEDKDLPSPG